MTLEAVRTDWPRPALDRFRAAIARRIGLQFDDAKLTLLGDVLSRRLDLLSCSSEKYLQQLEDAPSQSELGALGRELTVGETYFFRHNDQFRALAEVVLPQRMRARESDKTLNFGNYILNSRSY